MIVMGIGPNERVPAVIYVVGPVGLELEHEAVNCGLRVVTVVRLITLVVVSTSIPAKGAPPSCLA